MKKNKIVDQVWFQELLKLHDEYTPNICGEKGSVESRAIETIPASFFGTEDRKNLFGLIIKCEDIDHREIAKKILLHIAPTLDMKVIPIKVDKKFVRDIKRERRIHFFDKRCLLREITNHLELKRDAVRKRLSFYFCYVVI